MDDASQLKQILDFVKDSLIQKNKTAELESKINALELKFEAFKKEISKDARYWLFICLLLLGVAIGNPHFFASILKMFIK